MPVTSRAQAFIIIILFISYICVLKPILGQGDDCLRRHVEKANDTVNRAILLTKDNFIKSKKLTPSDLLKLLRYPSLEAAKLAKAEDIFEIAALNCQTNTGRMHMVTLSNTARAMLSTYSGCKRQRRSIKCKPSKFRTADGSCNNINKPLWGTAVTSFNRLLPPVYENGFNTPVGWGNSGTLPSARLVSRRLLSSQTITEDFVYTHMLMQWGQFLDHDLDLTPSSPSNIGYGNSMSCKDTCINQHPCFPIQIPPGDPRIHKQKCMEFTRSSAACSDGPREQINDITSYIDGSNVYGSSSKVSKALRDLDGNKGLLKTGLKAPSGKPLLPFNKDPSISIECGENESGVKTPCFFAGDRRANEQLGLLSMHTLWMREHNRIAKSLGVLNPHWDGERIYQEARKIVGAEMQHITFKEWLPKVLGPKGMKRIGRHRGYDSNVDASIVNVFATAAFRFGHSIIHPILQRLDESFVPIKQGNLPLHKAFFAPHRLVEEDGIDPLLRGLFGSPAKFNGDTTKPMNSEVTERLFELVRSVALDLGALNIQRGRDHGLPGYNRWREYCNLPRAKTFDDLRWEIKNPAVRAKLKELYSSPDYIDLFPGGLVEDPLPGSRIGPVFNCIISEQFKRLRSGDRYWYVNRGQFKKEQLAELEKVTLAKVLCENGDNINRVQRDVFKRVREKSEYISCRNIPAIDLSPWQDKGPRCPKPNGRFRHPGNCHMYIHCVHGILHEKYCPHPLHFNPSKKRCEWSSYYCRRKGFCSDKNDGVYPHPRNCRLFYVCLNGTRFIKRCRSWRFPYFNPGKKICVQALEVYDSPCFRYGSYR